MSGHAHGVPVRRGAQSGRRAVTSKWVTLLLLGLCFVFLLFVRLYVDHNVTGDEPHYLLMDYSLVHDHDMDLSNNYAHKDYLHFYPIALGTKYQVAPARSGGGLYSIHGAGVPMLLLPGFWLAGARGAEIEMVLVATATIWLTWVWVYEMTGRPRASAAAAGLLAVSSFFAGLAGYIYPDMPIAALTLAALIIIARYFDRTAWQILFGVITVALVFVHFKTLDLALPLLAALVYRLWNAKRELPWAAILSSGLLLAAFFVGFHHWYGVWDPEHIYPSNISLKTSPLHNIPAMLFDVKRGALIYNPALLLMLVGLGAWFRQRREMFLLTLLAVGPSMAVLAVFNAWEGGYAPTGRYLIDFLPALFPAIAFALSILKANWQKAVIVLIMLATLFITLESTFIKAPYINGNQYRPQSAFFNKLERQTGIGFQHLLPNYSKDVTLNDRHGSLKLLIGWLAVLSLTGYGYYLSKPLKPIRPAKATKA